MVRPSTVDTPPVADDLRCVAEVPLEIADARSETRIVTMSCTLVALRSRVRSLITASAEKIEPGAGAVRPTAGPPEASCIIWSIAEGGGAFFSARSSATAQRSIELFMSRSYRLHNTLSYDYADVAPSRK
jgi:hypothetical protein